VGTQKWVTTIIFPLFCLSLFIEICPPVLPLFVWLEIPPLSDYKFELLNVSDEEENCHGKNMFFVACLMNLVSFN
jgi:hypothetical protein